MRSSEVAAIAGVTVRTLRHYHQVGVLAEPERSANGYREYDVHHVVRLLRIKRLSGLGIPLTEIPAILDVPDEQDTLLERLDAELGAEIARLTAQRDVIAQLRAARTAPDLPPEFGRYSVLAAAAGVSSTLGRFDREQLILLAHLVGPEGTVALARIMERIADPETFGTYLELNDRFAALDDGSTDEEFEAVVAGLASASREIQAGFAPEPTVTEVGRAAGLFTEHSADLLNTVQLRAWNEIERRLEGTG